MSRRASLSDVVRAQMTLLYGKWRPVMSLSDDEKTAMQADRSAAAEELLDYLRAMDVETHELIQAVRTVTREIMHETRSTMPDPAEIGGRIKGVFNKGSAPKPCAGCKTMGGYYTRTGPDEPLYEPALGTAPWGGGVWLCFWHHETANWYVNRKLHDLESRAWPYKPPFPLLPRGVMPYDRSDWTDYTDGPLSGPMGDWAREFAAKVLNVEIDGGRHATPAMDFDQDRGEWESL